MLKNLEQGLVQAKQTEIERPLNMHKARANITKVTGEQS